MSDTFATALWAPDALFELLRAGVGGVNVHVRPYPINAAFAVTPRGLRARPLLYGLILFARTLGPGAQLLDARLTANHPESVKVWAVRVGGRELHVRLINKGKHAVSVDLRLPRTGPATVQRLLAPSVAAPSGVTRDGRQLGGDGAWHGMAATETVTPGAGEYELTLPPTSAALVNSALPALVSRSELDRPSSRPRVGCRPVKRPDSARGSGPPPRQAGTAPVVPSAVALEITHS